MNRFSPTELVGHVPLHEISITRDLMWRAEHWLRTNRVTDAISQSLVESLAREFNELLQEERRRLVPHNETGGRR